MSNLLKDGVVTCDCELVIFQVFIPRIKASTLNGSDICSGAKLETFILGAHLNWFYRSFVIEDVGSAPPPTPPLDAPLLLHIDLPGLWEGRMCGAELDWSISCSCSFISAVWKVLIFCSHNAGNMSDLVHRQRISSNGIWQCVKITDLRH